ncbi:MAG: acetyltransferase [Lachnospiraceae bacterium]|nr:acetyltransferase [Lachnospiraceae bacterium]
MKRLVIIGASGHGKVVADIAKKNGYGEIVFLDDNENLNECDGYSVVGKSSDSYNYSCDVFVAIGNANIRKKIQEELVAKGHHVPVLIHPNAVIGENVKIGDGTVVMAGAVINACTLIGKGCIINTCSSVDHDCRISDYVHISVGAHLAGTVRIGEKTWIGIGALVSNNVDICEHCMIGAGAVVIKNIDKIGTYIGVPARVMSDEE